MVKGADCVVGFASGTRCYTGASRTVPMRIGTALQVYLYLFFLCFLPSDAFILAFLVTRATFQGNDLQQQ